ncbi:hypothetical protein ACFPN2_01045 [Steroidobacter flavus]|uniref:DUF1440 domain-containing protein n=1 Tax=Steroidobacter flavus TaxID=1842136 RepID=A0ABV8SJW8_9GAMM
MPRNRAAYAILWGGLIAGLIDISYAVGFSATRGVPPSRILQSVASGLLGSPAYQGGHATATLGLILHFVLMMIIAAIFYFASTRLRFLVERPVGWGALYGFLVYWVMNLVVLPLSAFPSQVKFVPILLITSLIVHAFGIGVPIALASRKAHAM